VLSISAAQLPRKPLLKGDAGKLKRLLITGGSGDLGRPLSECAVAAGREVWVTYWRRPERIKAGQPIQLNLNDHDAVRAVLDRLQPDVIIHTAVWQDSPDQREQIISSAVYLCQWSSPETRLILLSTDMVFDGQKAPYRDDDPPSPLSAYGQAKAETESMGDCVVRTSLIYDFERGNKQVDWMLDAIAGGERCRLFRDEFRSPIWAVNLGEALLELADSDFRGVLNVAGPRRMSRLELGRGLLEALGYPPDDHVESVSQAGTGRPPDLTLDVSQAQALLKTPLLTFEEARARWPARRAW
jgi:dTDP-4-dehydrorhamnose reductase